MRTYDRARHTTVPAMLTAVLSGCAALSLAGVAPAAAAPDRPGAAHTEARAAAAKAAMHDDFNGDGYHDLVVAAPDAAVGGAPRSGYVCVLYGSAHGIGVDGARSVIDQGSPGVPGTPEEGDAFGGSVASADLDLDGYADLLVGAPGEDVGTVADAGRVTVLWGSAHGLTGASSWLGAPQPTAHEGYGSGLAGADLNGDGRPELALVTRTGRLDVHAFASDRLATPATSTVRLTTESGAAPSGLTAGDYDHDGYADLVALGTHPVGETVEGWSVYLRGGATGPSVVRAFHGGPAGASGDINKDGYDDLVIGEPSRLSHGEELTAGTVQVWYGGAHGPWGQTSADDPQRWQEGAGGVPGGPIEGDHFGSDVSVGDVDGDGYPDVSVGSDGQSFGEDIPGAGAVWLLRGAPAGVTSAGVQYLTQNTAGVPGTAEFQDRFGAQVRLIDANGDGRAGLVATAPGENASEGCAWVFSGTSRGLTTDGSWTFSGHTIGASVTLARFGSSVAQ